MIKLNKVSKKYRTTQLETMALDGVDFALEKGEEVVRVRSTAVLRRRRTRGSRTWRRASRRSKLLRVRRCSTTNGQ